MAATGGAAQIEVTRLTVDQTLSSRINLMRILLIGGIVFVHVPYDAQTSPFFTGAFGLFDWLRVFLGESLFRIGVPCLSAISGYLLFRRGYAAFDYGKTLRAKATTVLTPFLLWNLGLLLAVLLMQSVSLGIGYFPDLWQASPRDLLSHGLALEGFPVNLPLYFLRDLLVCILLSPILAYLVRRAPVATCAALFILAVLPGVTIGIVLKKSILFSFTFGMALALHAGAATVRAGQALELPCLSGIRLADLWTGGDFGGGRWYLSTVDDGLSLLARQDIPIGRLTVVGAVDAFSPVLDLPPGDGDGGVVDLRWSGMEAVSPERALAGADTILFRNPGDTPVGAAALYLDFVGRNFSRVGESQHWILFRRNQPTAVPE